MGCACRDQPNSIHTRDGFWITEHGVLGDYRVLGNANHTTRRTKGSAVA